MEIAIQVDSESTSQGFTTQQMRVDTRKEAKLFHMLSNTLYSNKPAAIIRELCSNAYDSHLMAGCLDRPIEITAPTLESPELVIRDYGVGLTSAEAVETILCYLGSSKDSSDDFIGGWGIGSKSPFSYAKNYTVICYKAGTRAEFMCWKDEHGLPQSALVSEAVTADPSGVEMRVPIESLDVKRFNEAIREYMAWTNYNVVVLRAGMDPQKPREASMKVSRQGYDIELRPGIGGFRLVYGGYSYDMGECLEQGDDFRSIYEQILEKKNQDFSILIVASVPNSVTFNMNREEIEQTEKSKAFVQNAIQDIAENLKARREFIEETSESFYKASKDGVTNLVQLQQKIDESTKVGDEFDRIISSGFTIFESVYRYQWRGQVYKVANGSYTPKSAYQQQFKIENIASQISVLWSRNLRPPRNNVYNAIQSAVNKRQSIFIVAKDREEAVKKISEMEDFQGFDISGIDFVEVVNPAQPRSPNPGTRGPMPPRPYCRVKKSYIKWNDSTLYVTAGPGFPAYVASKEFAGLLDKWEVTRASEHRWDARGGFVVFNPTPDFISKEGSRDNVITLDEFKDLIVKQFNDKVQELALPSNLYWIRKFEKMHGRATAAHPCAPRHLLNEFEKMLRPVDDWWEQASAFMEKISSTNVSINTTPLLRRDCRVFNKHMETLQKGLDMIIRAEKDFQFVDFRVIQAALKMRENESKERKSIRLAAEKLVKSLKLDKYFKEK